jgi:hypothetical protein
MRSRVNEGKVPFEERRLPDPLVLLLAAGALPFWAFWIVWQSAFICWEHNDRLRLRLAFADPGASKFITMMSVQDPFR